MSSIPNAINILVKCAHSPRVYRHFLDQQKLKVLTLSNQSQQIGLPASDQWAEKSKQILANSAPDCSLHDDKEENQPGHLLRRRFGKVDVVRGPVHCECLLALYLLSQNSSGISSVRYIGVSKLSCLACFGFLRALRENGITFYTKGCHAKAYFP